MFALLLISLLCGAFFVAVIAFCLISPPNREDLPHHRPWSPERRQLRLVERPAQFVDRAEHPDW